MTFAVDVVVVGEVVGKHQAPEGLFLWVPHKLELLEDGEVTVVLSLTPHRNHLRVAVVGSRDKLGEGRILFQRGKSN